MKITIQITDARVSDLLHGHGGGSSPWLHAIEGKWNSKRGARAQFDREDDDEGAGTGRMRIGKGAVARGLSIMAQKFPYQFGQFLDENDDDLTFDTVMQCIIFGKEVYA